MPHRPDDTPNQARLPFGPSGPPEPESHGARRTAGVDPGELDPWGHYLTGVCPCGRGRVWHGCVPDGPGPGADWDCLLCDPPSTPGLFTGCDRCNGTGKGPGPWRTYAETRIRLHPLPARAEQLAEQLEPLPLPPHLHESHGWTREPYDSPDLTCARCGLVLPDGSTQAELTAPCDSAKLKRERADLSARAEQLAEPLEPLPLPPGESTPWTHNYARLRFGLLMTSAARATEDASWQDGNSYSAGARMAASSFRRAARSIAITLSLIHI
jgi:hypothetical protein